MRSHTETHRMLGLLAGKTLTEIAEEILDLHDEVGALQGEIEENQQVAVEALKAARHALVTTENLRATDLTQEIFDAHLGNGVPREQLEFTIDDGAEIARVDAALAQLEAA